MESECKAYAHPELNKDIVAIGGYYVFMKEIRTSFEEQELLYFIGCGVIDRSCCGEGGIVYAFVPGFVAEWKSDVHHDGSQISKVKPVTDPKTQREIVEWIRKRENIHQVNPHNLIYTRPPCLNT